MSEKPRYSKVEAKQIQNTFRALAAVSVAVIIIGVITMMYLEGWSAVDSLYFSVVSLTTVGYGDLTPTTVGGKLFVVGYLIVGIGIIAAFINNLLKSYAARRILKKDEE
jgi:voltage-gated potassium channel Kch